MLKIFWGWHCPFKRAGELHSKATQKITSYCQTPLRLWSPNSTSIGRSRSWFCFCKEEEKGRTPTWFLPEGMTLLVVIIVVYIDKVALIFGIGARYWVCVGGWSVGKAIIVSTLLCLGVARVVTAIPLFGVSNICKAKYLVCLIYDRQVS